MNKSLNITDNWAKEQNFDFSFHKCHAMMITRKLKYHTPMISLQNKNITYSRCIKLLGLTIDDNLNFNQHIKEKCSKCIHMTNTLLRFSRQTWGLDREALNIIYTYVFLPTILYSAEIWFKEAKLKCNQKLLRESERMICLRILKTYRTTPRIAALILTGKIPLELQIEERERYKNILNEGTIE